MDLLLNSVGACTGKAEAMGTLAKSPKARRLVIDGVCMVRSESKLAGSMIKRTVKESKKRPEIRNLE